MSRFPTTNQVTGPQKYMDEYTIYCDSGVATRGQISDSLKKAIKEAELILGYETKCRFKINLLINREGEYFGYGYIWVSCKKIYWMLLGRNPDGTERIEKYPDPDWTPPSPKEIKDNMKWNEIVEEEDAFVQPMIKKNLPPLVTIPGYLYDEDQLKHLEELREDEQDVPSTGYFEISRAYALESPIGTIKNRICARNVPDWLPIEAFKATFSFYVTKNKEDYPHINFVDSKKGGRMVFITFDPSTKDALFTLLMTKKTILVNPKNKNQKVTLIFMHAYDNSKNSKGK